MAYSGPVVGNEALEAVKEWAAQKVHSHQISDIANLQTELNGKAPSAHTHVCADVTDLETKLGEYAKKTEIAGVYKYKGSCTWAELIAKTDAALKDNTGKEIVPAGGPSVEDSVITGSMNYFVEGVEVA